MTFRSKSCILTKESCERFIQKRNKTWCGTKETRRVTAKVSIIDIGWLFEGNKTFLDLLPYVRESDNNIFQTTFIVNLLEEFWKTKNKKDIVLKLLIPYIAYMVTTIAFLYCSTFFFEGDYTKEELEDTKSKIERDDASYRWMLLLLGLTFIQWSYQAYCEIV